LNKLLLKTESTNGGPDITAAGTNLREDAYRLAREIFKNKETIDKFTRKVVEVCTKAEGKDLLIVHNPGGWGHAQLSQCLAWERGIVVGIEAAVREMGHSCFMTQYLRSGEGWREEMRDLKEQFRFFNAKANIMAAWLQFVITHVNGIKVILIGISQGAAFGSAVMQRLGDYYPVYSIELGFPFMYKSRRVISGKTVAIEGNRSRPDVMTRGNMWIGVRILVAAFFRWIRYNLEGRPIPLALCINAPGHEYDWGNPEIQTQIRDFLEANFHVKVRAR
jgi:pimeloyl-ACP methyl ester carboxylesterase